MVSAKRSKFPHNARLVGSHDSVYRVIKRLGKGGNGTAYLTLCEAGKMLGCLSVVKVLEAWQDAERFRRFAREVNVTRALHHPAIVRIYDEGFIGVALASGLPPNHDYPFYAMEYYQQTLTSANRAGITIYGKLLLCAQLCSALVEVAKLNAVHRDIKPSNIFVSGLDCVLADFGLLRDVDSSTDHSPGAMAKNYPSPELLEYERGGNPPGLPSDIFQLGVVLTELLTAEVPLSFDSIGMSVKEPKVIRGDFGEETRSVLKDMLHVDPALRIDATIAATRFGNILWKSLLAK